MRCERGSSGFCEIATCEDGVLRSAGRVKTTPEALEVLAPAPTA